MTTITRSAETVTRETQEPDVIYLSGSEDGAFVSPDGEGRVWYTGADEAREDRGDLPVVTLDYFPED